MALTIAFDADTLPEDALYTHYQGQVNPQRVYLTLSESGEIGYETELLGGGVSSYRWHNRTLAWGLPIVPTPSALESLIEDLKPLLERVHAGHCVKWDGNNYVGKLTEDATDASDEIERYIDKHGSEYDCVDSVDRDDTDAPLAVFNYGNFVREIKEEN